MSQPEADSPSDAELLASHVAGDPDAFGELFLRHRDRLWAVALRTTRDPEEASDALQDAMISAFRRADTFRGTAKVSTWLHRIVVNACLDRMRSRRSRPAVALSDHHESHTRDSHDPIEQHDVRMVVLAGLRELPPDQRAAIVLVDLEGWSVADAAEILECRPGTVKSRCHRGRLRLAELLGNPDGTGTVSDSDNPESETIGAGGPRASADRGEAPANDEEDPAQRQRGRRSGHE